MGLRISVRLAVASLWVTGLIFGRLTAGLHPQIPPAQIEGPPSAPPPAETQTIPQRPALSLEDRADIFMARKAYADAVACYYRALKQAGNSNPILWNKLGIAYQQQSNYRAARKAYNMAIRYKRDFPEPWNNLGTTYFLQDRHKKSVGYYRRALELNPDSPSFHMNLGTSYYRLKKYKEAIEEYRAALLLDPNVLSDRGTTGTVVQARSADAEYFFYLAKAFASLGRAEEAVRYLRRAFEDGFTNRKQLDEDPDFLTLSAYPAYVELRKNPPLAIRD